MSRRWWPFGRRRSKASAQQQDPGERRDPKLDETRRIVRDVVHKTKRLRPSSKPKPRPKRPTVNDRGSYVHVDFHRDELLWLAVDRMDPITKKTRRVKRATKRTTRFYRKDGTLYDGDGAPPP